MWSFAYQFCFGVATVPTANDQRDIFVDMLSKGTVQYSMHVPLERLEAFLMCVMNNHVVAELNFLLGGRR